MYRKRNATILKRNQKMDWSPIATGPPKSVRWPNGLDAPPKNISVATHETPVGTETLLGLPDRRTVRLGTVGQTDADVYGDFL